MYSDLVKITDSLSVWKHVTGSFVLEFRELQDDGSTCSHDIWLDAEAVERLIAIIGAPI